MGKYSRFEQYYTVFCANIVSFTYGITSGWPSASLPLLQSDESPLASGPLTVLEGSWIGSILCIGGAIGTLFTGWASEKWGHKLTVLFSSAPLLVSWVLIEFGTEFYALFASRFLSGFAGGAAYVIVPLIATDIADVSNRGTLCSMLILFVNGGVITGFALCSYLDYYTVPWIGIALCGLFWVGYVFLPSPDLEADVVPPAETLKCLETVEKVPEKELLRNEETKMTYQDLQIPAVKRGIWIGVILMSVGIFAGPFVLLNYYHSIFEEAGSTLSPEVSSILVGFIQLIGTYLATVSVDRLGRRKLLIFAAYFSIACLTILGVHSMLKDYGINPPSLSWIPLACLSFMVLICNMGVIPIIWVILAEIFDTPVRGPLVSFCTFVNWMESFVMVLLFPHMMHYLKMYGTLWVFCGIQVVLVTVLVFLLPETKGLSIEQITAKLGRTR